MIVLSYLWRDPIGDRYYYLIQTNSPNYKPDSDEVVLFKLEEQSLAKRIISLLSNYI